MKVMIKAYTAILFSAVLVLVADMAAFDDAFSIYILSADVMPSVLALWLMASSMSENFSMKWTVGIALAVNAALFGFHLTRLAGFSLNPSAGDAVAAISVVASLMTVLFVCGLASRMRDIKALMKNGTVWAVVCLAVDMAYFCFTIAAAAIIQFGYPLPGFLLLCGSAAGLWLRLKNDCKFIIWQNQERIILESMKVTSVSAAVDSSYIEDVYKDLYERTVAYFEVKKPYLDNELTINMLVKDLYSNKLYISRAISQFTGRNFCQFVNYYRIMHSIESFRNNPELKVHELASMSGFNSIVSFNMAFRLFMGVNPSEWCRKEKSRLIKKR